jgi:hypothetical protein
MYESYFSLHAAKAAKLRIDLDKTGDCAKINRANQVISGR